MTKFDQNQGIFAIQKYTHVCTSLYGKSAFSNANRQNTRKTLTREICHNTIPHNILYQSPVFPP